ACARALVEVDAVVRSVIGDDEVEQAIVIEVDEHHARGQVVHGIGAAERDVRGGGESGDDVVEEDLGGRAGGVARTDHDVEPAVAVHVTHRHRGRVGSGDRGGHCA